MSAVLRKKIDAGAGVPPSILQLQAFWAQLQTKAREWAEATYNLETKAALASRRVINGKQAQQILESQIAVYFSATASPGIAALAIDTAGAMRNAAARMNQEPDSLADASPLFLKLLSEQAVADLWRTVRTGVFDEKPSGAATPIADASGATGRFEADARYLQVEYELMLEGQSSRVWLMFAFDFMRDFARTWQRQQADQKVQARHHSQKTLSDSVRASTIVLDAVLDRLSLTIGDCSKLEVGSVLTLTGADAGRLNLSADTINGSVDIGSGELGVWKRQRALKLTAPISESFAREIADL